LYKTSKLTVIELQNADNEVVKYVQQANFPFFDLTSGHAK